MYGRSWEPNDTMLLFFKNVYEFSTRSYQCCQQIFRESSWRQIDLLQKVDDVMTLDSEIT